MNKILVVDDDMDILTLMEMTLSMNNYSVKAIARWEEIYESIDQFNPDLIILDVSLGGADGREICKNIKRSDRMQRIPVVLFSANAEMGRHVSECGAQAFIAKPYTLAALLQTIRENLN
ncbi:MAG: response regulator [Chitinophagaceae bacterium]